MPRTLRVGEYNPDVLKLQDILTAQGHFKSTAPVSRYTVGLQDAVFYFQQTHLGPDGMPLVVDGIVGPDTWWALTHPHGKFQRSYLRPGIPEGIIGERAKVLAVALSEHAKNVREIPNGSNRSKEIDKYFPPWLQKKLVGTKAKGHPWCCFSMTWIFHEGTGRWPTNRRTGHCATMVKQAKELGIYHPACRYTPSDAGSRILRPGDIFVILHPKQPGKPQTGHTGLVGSVNKQQTLVGTLEGNCGNRFKAGRRNVGDLTGIINPYFLAEDCVTDFDHSLPGGEDVARASTR